MIHSLTLPGIRWEAYFHPRCKNSDLKITLSFTRGHCVHTCKVIVQLTPSPRKSSGAAIGALRKLLVEKNTQEFQNPSDPTAINVMKAFLKYDKDRCVYS